MNVILKQPIDVFDTINMILLVGIYDNHITFNSKTGIGANHYAVAVYIVHRNMVMYCDPKGWPTPATFKSELIDALSAYLLYLRALSMNVIEVFLQMDYLISAHNFAVRCILYKRVEQFAEFRA